MYQALHHWLEVEKETARDGENIQVDALEFWYDHWGKHNIMTRIATYNIIAKISATHSRHFRQIKQAYLQIF